MKLIGVIILGLCLLPTAVAAQNAADPGRAAVANPQPSDPGEGAYRLFPGDVVELRFFFNPELNDQVQIRPDGRISMPLIGEVAMAGKTIPELLQELRQAYAPHLKNPQINLQVRSFSAQRVYVTGEVVRPGIVNMPGPLTLIAAIGEAGGIKPTGNAKSVVLVRKVQEDIPQKRKITIFAEGKPTRDAGLLLRPFDIVMVPESKITQVDRWVDQHIKQLNPGNLVFGFEYILKNPTATSTVIPF